MGPWSHPNLARLARTNAGEILVRVAHRTGRQRAGAALVHSAAVSANRVRAAGYRAVARSRRHVTGDFHAAASTLAAQQRPLLALAIVDERADAIFASARTLLDL